MSTPRQCIHCNSSISSGVVYFFGGFWHDFCFVCSLCGNGIVKVGDTVLITDLGLFICASCEKEHLNVNHHVGGRVVNLADHIPEWQLLEELLIHGGNQILIELIVQCPSLVNMTNKQKETLLYLAAKYGNADLTKFLLLHPDTDVNVQQWSGSTPLHAACYHKQQEIGQLLIAQNARIDVKNLYGSIPRDEASKDLWDLITGNEDLLGEHKDQDSPIDDDMPLLQPFVADILPPDDDNNNKQQLPPNEPQQKKKIHVKPVVQAPVVVQQSPAVSVPAQVVNVQQNAGKLPGDSFQQLDEDLYQEAKEDDKSRKNWVGQFRNYMRVRVRLALRKRKKSNEDLQDDALEISEDSFKKALKKLGISDIYLQTTGYSVVNGVKPEDRDRLSLLTDPDDSPALAIAMYTGTLYKNLNRNLRDEEIENPKNLQYWTNVSSHMIKGLGALPIEASTVFRGCKFTGDREQYKPGATIAWNAFSSTSRDKRVAKMFAGNGNQDAHIFIIHTQKAKDISFVSNYPKEKELLLTAGTFFRILKIYTKEESKDFNIYTIEMEEWEVQPHRISLWVGSELQKFKKDKAVKEARKEGVELHFLKSVPEAEEWINKRNYLLTRSRKEFRVVVTPSANKFVEYIGGIDYAHTTLIHGEILNERDFLCGFKFVQSRGDRQTLRFGCFIPSKGRKTNLQK